MRVLTGEALGSWPISAYKSGRKKKVFRWAESFTPIALIKRPVSLWIAIKPVCRSSFSKTSPASWSGATQKRAELFAAVRSWVDAIIQPHETRDVLIQLLQYASRPMPKGNFHTGVIQV